MNVPRLIGSLTVLLISSTAVAQHSWLQPYMGLADSPFHEFGMSGTLSLEDFEDGDLDMEGVAVATPTGVQYGMAYVSSSTTLSQANSITEDTGDPTTGSFLLGVPVLCATTYPPICPATTVLEFDADEELPTFAGFVWTDAVASINPQSSLPFAFATAFAGGEEIEMAQVFHVPAQDPDDVTADDLFIGVVDHRGIERIEFRVLTDLDGGYLAMDHLQFGFAAIPGDANRDGAVGFLDFVTLAENFGGAGDWSGGDFNFDGIVDFSDFLSLSAHFNQSFDRATPSLAVPDPTSAAVACLAFVGIVAFGRHTRSRPPASN